MKVLERQEQEAVWQRPKFVEELRVRMRIGAKGRIVIPAAMRKATGIADGDMLILRVVDDELHISTIRGRIRRAQRNVRHLVPPGTLVSDELSAERREAARNE
jgi:AbrB family looped-hinge helix DNA binding protein